MKPTVPTVDSADQFALEFMSFGHSVINASNDDGSGGGGAATVAATSNDVAMTTMSMPFEVYCAI